MVGWVLGKCTGYKNPCFLYRKENTTVQSKQHLEMWEVLVPTHDNDGQKYPLEHHQQWDGFIQNLCGGQTLLKVARGRWVDRTSGKLYDETVIPVRIACTHEQLEQIGEFTLSHYNQIEVLTYLVSEQVIFFRADTGQRAENTEL